MEPTYALTTDILDYTIDELDDIADRKVGPIPVGGDSLARLIRARRGTARATGEFDAYNPRVVNAGIERLVWPASERTAWTARSRGNRRMAAVGGTGGHGGIETQFVDAEDNYSTIH